MKARISNVDRKHRHPFFASFVMAALVSGAVPGSETLSADAEEQRSLDAIQAAADQGDADAIYWLAMLHIQGSIADADYEKGIELLKSAAFRGNKDAERIFGFMDNAFSGEGC